MSERLRVLLVEDNPADADLIRETLREQEPVSFRLEAVSRLAEARERVRRGDLDVILLDLGLPDSQGIATFKSLQEAASDIPTIVLTGNEDQEMAVAAVRLGAQDYLIKGQVVGNVLARAARYAVERQRAEETLRESERKLREAQRLGRIGHWEFDLDTQAIRWSETVFTIYEREPSLGPPSAMEEAAYYTPENAERLRAAVATAIETGAAYELEVPIRLAGGKLKHVVATGTPVADTNGRIGRLLGTIQDVTRLKLAEEHEIHLNRILRAVRDVDQLIVRERDPHRLIRETCKLLVEGRGYRSAMVILSGEAGAPLTYAEAGMGDAFQPLADHLQQGVLPTCCLFAGQHEGIFHVTDRAGVCGACPVRVACAVSDASSVRLRHGGLDFGYLTVSVDATLGVDAEEESLLAEVAGDLSFALHGVERAKAMTLVEGERDRAEGELRQSQKMEAIGRLAGGVAHDFNNVLTVINTSCSFLEEALHASEPLLEDVRTIRSASESAARLTRQLLAFSRRQVLQPRPIDLHALIRESERMLSRLLGEDIRIRVEPAAAVGVVLADPGQIEQVIVNLAVNARDAMPDGGTLTITTVNVTLDEAFVGPYAGSNAGPYVRLVVADSGCGMDAETQTRIFEPFFTTKAVGRGTGLGLPTVYGIVKQSGGFITVDSDLGHGAAFAIYLPRVETAGEPWRPASTSGSSRSLGETILLVEDNYLLRAAAARALRKLGYKVFEAAGLDEARRIAATERPIHLVLTDVVMPGGSGRDVSTALTAAHPAVKVLFMSGFTDDAISHHGVLDPGTAFLHKPFTLESLGRKVRDVLDGGT